MAKKHSSSSQARSQGRAHPSKSREKAAQLRAEQERADKKMRTLIIGTVVGVVALVVAVVAYVISGQVQAQEEAATVDPATVLGVYSDGRPIVLTPSGIGEADPALPTLSEYFDYSCQACAQAEVLFGDKIAQDVKAGKYNVAYQPVSGHAPYQLPAVSASLVVAQKAPEQWHDFHHALMRFFVDQKKAGEGRIIGDLNKSAEQVRELALSVGVPEEVVATFPVNAAEDYLHKAHDAWSATQVEGREGFFTPEFVANGTTKVALPSFEPEAVMSVLRDALRAD